MKSKKEYLFELTDCSTELEVVAKGKSDMIEISLNNNWASQGDGFGAYLTIDLSKKSAKKLIDTLLPLPKFDPPFIIRWKGIS